MARSKGIWITWEKHRRSIELAGALEVELYVMLQSSTDIPNRFARYVWLSLNTGVLLLHRRPKVLIVQNPSIMLAFLACLLRPILGYSLIVDRHSNFKLHVTERHLLKWKIFDFLSRFTVRHADMTIVTNPFLNRIVEEWGGSGFILQDKLPALSLAKQICLKGTKNIVIISTFSDDEPIPEIMESVKGIDPNWHFYMTGKYHGTSYDVSSIPPSLTLTGFLPEKQYQSLLLSADVCVVLTKRDHLLNCGFYEAISLCKILVVSDTQTIRDYLNKGVVYTKPVPSDIQKAIRQAITEKDRLISEIFQLKRELEIDWLARFTSLRRWVTTLTI